MTFPPATPAGATSLDADELASLIPSHVATQGELNEWEQLNIVQGELWARKQRKDVLNEGFVRLLHKRMFGQTWKWAGEFRRSDKNIGVDWRNIGMNRKNLLDDVRYQVEHGSLPADEIAIRFHHRLVAIHPFPTVPYGIYVAHGFVSSFLAKQTGFGEEDLELLWQALEHMFEHDRSAARGEMATRGLYVFKHDAELGNAHAHALFDRIKVMRKADVDVARSFADYEVSIDESNLPGGVSLIKRV